MEEYQKIIIASAAGAAVGAAAGILLAPQSGKKTRKQLSRKKDRMALKTREQMEDIQEAAEMLAEKARNLTTA